MMSRTSRVCFLRECHPTFHPSQWLFQERKRVQLGYRLYRKVRGKIRIDVAVSFFRLVWSVLLRKRMMKIVCLLVVQRPKKVRVSGNHRIHDILAGCFTCKRARTISCGLL